MHNLVPSDLVFHQLIPNFTNFAFYCITFDSSTVNTRYKISLLWDLGGMLTYILYTYEVRANTSWKVNLREQLY